MKNYFDERENLQSLRDDQNCRQRAIMVDNMDRFTILANNAHERAHGYVKNIQRATCMSLTSLEAFFTRERPNDIPLPPRADLTHEYRMLLGYSLDSDIIGKMADTAESRLNSHRAAVEIELSALEVFAEQNPDGGKIKGMIADVRKALLVEEDAGFVFGAMVSLPALTAR